MSAFCLKCRRSSEVLRGHATTYGNMREVMDVSASLACRHQARFVTSWRQWKGWTEGKE